MGGKVAQLVAGRGQMKGLKGLVLPAEMQQQQLFASSSPQSAEYVARNVLSSSNLDDEVIDMLVEDMMKGSEFAKAAWTACVMAEYILEDARKIDVPVLVIAGELDRIETMERLKGEILGNVNGAELVIAQISVHLLPVETPREVLSLMREFVEKIGGWK